MTGFQLQSPYEPRGDQPKAIESLVEGVRRGDAHQVLLGATGTGKTFTIAQVIQRIDRPTLLIAHNKTLAAQLYGEYKHLFPNNAVEYFVSYYDYYQPEAYVPQTDTFIEKDSSINDEIDRMRHAATHSLLTRNDVLIVASVSCIYGLGTAEAYHELSLGMSVGQTYRRDQLLRDLVEIQYERNDIDFHRGTFRARGDTVEIFPPYEEDRAIRVEFFGDTIEAMSEIDPLRGVRVRSIEKMTVFPSSHYVTSADRRHVAMQSIRDELRERLQVLRGQNRLLEAQRLEQRTMFDLEMIEQMGFCSGIENYSRHVSGRAPGAPPPCLLDYFPKDFLLVIDESHQTIPQIGAMYRGDQARKQTLVEYGFRLPSALDNRPLKFDEFERLVPRVIYVSATPANYELEKAQGIVVEQIIRPTGLLDPVIEVRPVGTQVDDLLGECRERVAAGERVLVTTLTKRMSEDLTEYFADLGLRVRYLHSDIETLERTALLNDLRAGAFDILVGINLLREGLDLPEVSLVAILDADKEGFLRSTTSLIQTIGRAARNVNGRVLMYADVMTESMRRAIEETDRRRSIQAAHNIEHGIVPQSTSRPLTPMERSDLAPVAVPVLADDGAEDVATLERAMEEAAENLQFEKAAALRDRIRQLRGEVVEAAPAASTAGRAFGRRGGSGGRRKPGPARG